MDGNKIFVISGKNGNHWQLKKGFKCQIIGDSKLLVALCMVIKNGFQSPYIR
jgi:hypothetical protein